MHIKMYFLDIAGFDNFRVQHIVTSNEQQQNLGSPMTELTGNDSDLAWDTNDHHILHSKVPTKVMHERYSQALITIFNFWSCLAPSIGAVVSFCISRYIFWHLVFLQRLCTPAQFWRLITDYEMIKKQISLQYIPQLMSHLNMMVCLCLILT